MGIKSKRMKSAAGKIKTVVFLIMPVIAFASALTACRPSPREAGQQEIVIGVIDVFPALEEGVQIFNKGGYGCHAVIRDYGEGKYGQDRIEMSLRLQADLVSGQTPDLLFLDEETFSVISEGGALEDLASFLSGDGHLGREAFIDGLLERYTTEGGIYGLPRWLSIQTLWAGSAFFALEGEWDVDGMLTFMDQFPEVALTDGLTRERFLVYCLGMISKDAWGRDGFLEAFPLEDILKKAYGIPERGEELSLEEQCELLYQGEILFLDLDLDYVQMYLGAKQWNHGEPLIPIGYPAYGSAPKVLVSSVNGMLAIPRTSANQEGAWEFLSLFIDGSLNPDRRNVSDVFPATRKEWDAIVQGERFKNAYYERETFSDEDKNLIYDLLGMAGTYDYSALPIIEIIAEEAQFYFQDAKSLEETADLIWRRCRIFLEE